MMVSELREQIKHAEHMVKTRPAGKDRDVAITFLELANPMIVAIERQVVDTTPPK